MQRKGQDAIEMTRWVGGPSSDEVN
jgi:hypothetical protein